MHKNKVESVLRPCIGGLVCLRTRGKSIECEMLLADLVQHMRWEDRYLVRALGVDGKRAERIERDHREQSKLLSYVVAYVRKPASPAVLFARSMVIFADLLREDMRREEAQLFVPPASRDCETRFVAGMG